MVEKDGTLDCQHEKTNQYDRHAIAVLKSGQIVGHVPKDHAGIFYFYMKRGGQISVKITGEKQNTGTGLEIPAL